MFKSSKNKEVILWVIQCVVMTSITDIDQFQKCFNKSLVKNFSDQ